MTQGLLHEICCCFTCMPFIKLACRSVDVTCIRWFGSGNNK